MRDVGWMPFKILFLVFFLLLITIIFQGNSLISSGGGGGGGGGKFFLGGVFPPGPGLARARGYGPEWLMEK